jgi:hypothetical protein
MLCWWKRQVTRSYIKWVKLEYNLKEDKEDVTDLHLEGGNTWVPYGTDRYEWSSHGRDEYKRWWKERLVTTFVDIVPASDAIAQAAATTWWAWDEGSTPFHWRWPRHYMQVICDCLKVYFQHEPPKYRKAQRDVSDKEVKMKMKEKLAKVRKRRYIAPGSVESLTAFFGVPKGDNDIRLVYDGSVSGLNLTIWVPRFFLPTIRTHLRAVDENM